MPIYTHASHNRASSTHTLIHSSTHTLIHSYTHTLTHSYLFTDSAGFDAFPAGGAPGAAEAVGAGVDGGAGSDDCIIDYSFFSIYFFNFNSSIF